MRLDIQFLSSPNLHIFVWRQFMRLMYPFILKVGVGKGWLEKWDKLIAKIWNKLINIIFIDREGIKMVAKVEQTNCEDMKQKLININSNTSEKEDNTASLSNAGSLNYT